MIHIENTNEPANPMVTIATSRGIIRMGSRDDVWGEATTLTRLKYSEDCCENYDPHLSCEPLYSPIQT